MKILNPMFDAAFKYLIDDNTCAKFLLSEIIGSEIEVCELMQNEIHFLDDDSGSLGVMKLDFKAKIKTETGQYRLIIIEVQKAKMHSDLMRFRHYLGHQYSDKNNVYWLDGKKNPLPILSIYFLGFNIGIDNAIPILKIKPEIADYTTNKRISGSSYFIDSFVHDMIIIQTKSLKNNKRSKLETFLSNFQPTNEMFLEVNPKQFDRKFVTLLKRLSEATMKKEIVEAMQKENYFQEEWNSLQDELKSLKKEKESEKILLTEMIQLKEEERRQKEEERRQKEEERLLKIKAIKTMLELGIDPETIASKMGIDWDELKKIN